MLNARTVENFILSTMVAVAGFIANYVREMSAAITGLNNHVAVVLERVMHADSQLKDHELRLRGIENVR